MDMEGFAADQSTTDASNSTEKLFHPDRAISEKHDTKANSTELDCNSSILSADSQYSMYMCAVKQEHYNPTALGPVLEAFFAPNLAASEERINVENSDYPERTQIVADFLQQSTLYTTEHSTHFSQNQSLSVQDEGDDKILDLGGTYQNTCKVLGRHDPYDTPTHSSLIAPQASSFIMSSCTRGAVEQINSEPVASDTAITEANRLFLTDELLSEDSQDYNLNDVFGGLKSTFPPVLTPVPRKSSEFLEEQCMQMTAGRITEGRSVPSGHVNRLLPKRPVLDQPSGIGWAGMRKDDDTNEVIERVFSRKYLVTEHSEEAYPRLPSSNTISNSDSGENDINSTHCEIEIDEDDFEQHKSMSQQPKGSLETDIQVLSNLLGMRTLGNEVETRFGSEVQNIENQKNNIGDPCAFVGDYNDFCEPGDEVLVKTMGWFPMEEYSNENNDTNLSVHWILNEAPSASDLPHLESLLEISPSKFWSPESESKKRPPAHFGYLFRSEQSQSPRSIEYILKKTPASSPEVSGRILGGAPGVHISSKEPNHQCSQSRPDTHGAAQKILTPCMNTMISWTWRDSIERSIKSPTFGSGRNHAQVQLCIPEVSPVFSEDNNKNKTSRERNVALPANQDQPKGYTSTITASNGCISERREKNLKVGITAQRGKNLVIDFLKVGTTIQEKIEPLRNDVQSKDNLVSPSSTLRPHVENTSSAKMRLQFSEGLYTEERENASSSLGLQNLQGDDGNRFTKSDSPPLRPLSSSVMFQGRFQDDKNCIRKRDTPLVPLSDISNHPNLAARLRNSLHEKLESQVQFPKPVAVSEFLGNESLITEKCPQRLAPGNIAWSSPTIPRVSRKRSGRGTMPKDSKVEVSNMFTNGKVYRQTVRSTPDEDYYTCKKRKRTSKSTLVELQTFPRNVNLRLLVTSPSSECETDLRKMTMPEGMNVKSPILTRLVKPLQLIQSAPAKGRARTRIRTTPKGMRNRLSTEYRNASPVHFIKNSPIKHNADIIKAALRSAKNLGVNGTRTQRHEVEEETLSKGSADCETSKTAALRSSKYRGVTRHRHTGRYEAHLWDNSKVKLGLAKRGRQVYLGAYPDENEAAQAHDLAALKYWGPGVYTNFPPSLYEQELKTMKTLTKEEYILLLRRKSPGFTRGISKYRGVTRHHQEGRWEARIGRHSGAKYHYLGTYDTQEEAAVAYDRAAVVHRGTKAITNFDISNYIQKNPKAF